MYLMVDMSCHLIIYILLWHIWVESIKVFVQASGCMIMHMTFIAKDTRLHANQVIGRTFFPINIVSLLLILLRLQIIAWVILITDGEWYEVKLLQTVNDTTLASHRHHLQDRLLRAVITVLGTSFSLGYPNVLVFLLDGKVHIVGETLARHQHLAHT